MVNTKNNQCNG
jgi:hypothetical protein